MLENLVYSLPSNLFFDIVVIIIVATLFAYLARLIKQPMIPAYVIAGVIIGPLVLGLIKDIETIKLLSEIGIAFLLFMVGMEIDLKKLKSVSLVSTFGGLVQIVLTFLFGFFIAGLLGFDNLSALYLGLILAFSSTMVVVKLLSDKRELDTLHGRIILGILLVQDLVVILVLAILGGLSSFSYSLVLSSLLKGVLLLVVGILIIKYLFPGLFGFAAKSSELLFLVAVSICFVFAAFALSLGFSIAIGAFIAGVGIATLKYSYDIMGRIVSLKDFFSTIFFASLGMQLVWLPRSMIIPLVAFLVAVIFLKPLIIMILVSLFGYERRTSFLSSISLAQISEFALILVAGGLFLGHINQELFSFTVVLAILTIIFTSYFIKLDDYIYNLFSRPLKIFEKLSVRKQRLAYMPRGVKKRVVLFGCHRMGGIFLKDFKEIKRVLVVDYNPETIKKLMQKKIPCIYGDVANKEVMDRIRFKDMKIAISTIVNLPDNLFLVSYIKKANKKIIVIVVANHLHDALDLYEAGADYVILPHIMSGERVSMILSKILKKKKFLVTIRNRHIKHLLEFDGIK